MRDDEQKGGEQVRTIELEGRLGLQTGPEIKDLILKVMDEAESIVVSVGGESEADLSFIQMLCAAHRSALRRGKTLVFEWKCDGGFTELLEGSGFRLHGRCPHGRREDCLWTGRGA